MECWTDLRTFVMFSWEDDERIHVRRWIGSVQGEERVPKEFQVNDSRWHEVFSFAIPEKEECGDKVWDFRRLDEKVQTYLEGLN